MLIYLLDRVVSQGLTMAYPRDLETWGGAHHLENPFTVDEKRRDLLARRGTIRKDNLEPCRTKNSVDLLRIEKQNSRRESEGRGKEYITKSSAPS